MKLFKKIVLISLMFVWSHCCAAAEVIDQKIYLDLNNVNLKTSLYVLAKFIKMNMVIVGDVDGVASIHLKNASALKAFDVLLSTHNLIKWKVADTWFVGSLPEVVSRKQDDIKLQALMVESAQLVTRIWQINYARAEEVARLIQDAGNSLLTSRGHVKVDSRTNSICIQDITERLSDVDRLIRRLDVPVKQVSIEARLANVDHDFEQELGVNFNMGVSSKLQKGRYSIAVATLANGSLLDVQLAALENSGHGEVISSPKLFTANGQTASIEAGEEIPYQEGTLSGGTSVTFKKAVLSLKVTPQVLPGNKMLLQLQINQDKPTNRFVQGVPMISTRQMSTQVLIKSGQTLVLGGIYETNTEKAQQSIPFLGNIPIIGALFRQTNIARHRRELLIFVTPKIII